MTGNGSAPVSELLERSPWPGPRPFDPKGGHRLYGRDREVREVRQRLAQHRVLLFHALSGVGKTSLLRAGLYPALEKTGQVALLCSWGDLVGGEGSDPGKEFYAGALLRGLLDAGRLGDVCRSYEAERDHEAFLDEVFERLQTPGEFKTPVLVFDQVEEVMRRDRPLAGAFFNEVEEVAFEYPGIAQIISFRTEYRAYAEVLDKSLAPTKIASTYELLPLKEKEVVDVIRRPAQDWSEETGIPFAVDEDVAAELVGWWQEARALQTSMDAFGRKRDLPAQESSEWARDIKELGESEVGLLHMQAVLDAVFQRWVACAPDLPEVIDGEFLARFRSELVPDSLDPGRASARVMVESLRQYVARTFQRASRAELPGVPPAIAGFVRSLVERSAAFMAPGLSSGGFKTAKEVGELGADAVAALLNPLAVDDDWVSDTVRALTRSLTDERPTESRDLAPVGVGKDEADEPTRHDLSGGFTTDDAQNVAGPARALRLSPQQVQSAGALSAALAIAAMANEQVLRKAPTSRQTIYELVHDGFGPALRSWATTVLDRPRRRIDSPVTVLGEDIFWTAEDAQREIDGTEISGVRWIGCWLGTLPFESRLRFRDLVFRKAELRGTVFAHAHLRNVTFVDCKLNGVLFDDCVMENVTFAWSEERLPASFRNCDMLTFRQIASGPGEHDDDPPTSRPDSMRGPYFDRIRIRNMSVHNASGRWTANAATLEQVSLDADSDTQGIADFEVVGTSLRQWRFGHNWNGNLLLDRSDIDYSVSYGKPRIRSGLLSKVGPNNDFNAVDLVIEDTDELEDVSVAFGSATSLLVTENE